MCCHADEFCYHDPRKIAALADRGGYDLVSWYSPHFYPHPSELPDWETRRLRPVPERQRFYHWGHINTHLPWIEDRLYRDCPDVSWDESTHGSVRPHGIQNEAPFHPIFRHFKVIAADTAWCEVIGGSTYYQQHWQGLEHRTGVPFPVERLNDLFVASVPKYRVCDRFDGVFKQPWNMGEEFRPDRDRERETVQFSSVGKDQAGTENRVDDVTSVCVPNSVQCQKDAPPLRVALGPENPAFGSWIWLGADLSQELATDHEVVIFRESIPLADVVIFFKFLPDVSTLQVLRERSKVLFCPVDVYGSAAEIDADASRLWNCDRIIVHCRRLLPYFQSYAPTSFLDHHVKYTIPTRCEIVTDGPILWVGEQSNIPPVVEWVNGHDLPATLVILTNVPPEVRVQDLGFSGKCMARLEPWSHDNHLAWLKRCRGAFDIKGDDFRARHKSSAKALDFLASGIPFAMMQPSSSVDHVRELGFEIPQPEDVERWLSPDYAADCQRFGRMIREHLSLKQLGQCWRAVLREVLSDVRGGASV